MSLEKARRVAKSMLSNGSSVGSRPFFTRILLETRPPFENPILPSRLLGFAFKCPRRGEDARDLLDVGMFHRAQVCVCVKCTGKDRGDEREERVFLEHKIKISNKINVKGD